MLSPNHGERRDGLRPELIVIHYTAMADCRSAMARLCDPAAEVSAHYLIGNDGQVIPLVPEDRRAWHAGAGSWGGRADVNSRSIGIELDNPGTRPFAEPQMAALELLLPGIMARWDIPAQNVIAHSDMAPERKFDPGPRFDWRRLALGGLSIWPEPTCTDPQGLLPDLHAFGYPQAAPEQLLSAFRLRFRPWATGPATGADAGAARYLATHYPANTVDPVRASD